MRMNSFVDSVVVEKTLLFWLYERKSSIRVGMNKVDWRLISHKKTVVD